jgi:hypothetical protein
LDTTPSPTAVTLMGVIPVTLTDKATLAGGFSPTGTIKFTLFHGTTLVDTETVSVNGNGTYTTPTGFTLPTTGTVTGTYQWDASYNGDVNNNPVSDNGATSEQVTVSAASPMLTTTPSPTTVTLSAATPPILTDSATLAGGFRPGGTITFTLFHGSTLVDTETVTVNGNGAYNTPTGFTLPATGTVTGTYQWDASYSGDGNNNSVSDNNAANEQVTVNLANTGLITTPNPITVTLGATTPPVLKDVALVVGGFNPTGTLTFTLFYNGGTTPVDTETVTVNGNGTYTTPTGFALPGSGAVAGTYQWDASYSGDGNNRPVTDNNSSNEQVTVSPASPTLVTIPSPTTVMLSAATPPVLTDSATLAGGFSPTGTITFTLFYNGGSTPVDTETVTVNGNGTYMTPTGFTLPGTGTVTGTYQWDASYSGDGNNIAVSDNNDPTEQVTVIAATPAIITTPTPNVVTPGAILKDSATIFRGYNPTGTITFTLFFNGGTTPVDTETVMVNGNGTYTTPTGFPVPSSGPANGTYQWDAVYSGDGNNSSASDLNNPNEQVSPAPPNLTIRTVPDPVTVTLSASVPPVLTDTAVLQGGFSPTGTITFTLFYNGGTTPVDTETVTVNGNGTYTTPTGFTLPSTGTVTGTYQWDASYSGDGNNNPASDNNDPTEQVTVNPANTGLITTPNPITVTLGTTTPPILTDVAMVVGGFRPTGTLTFMLFYNGGTTPVDTETVTVNGNGTYTTPTGFALPGSGAVAGTYQWDASYSGDGNNCPVTDNNSSNEQVTVSPASPMLTTTPGPSTLTLSAATPPVLTDSAVLAGGFSPTGTITFTLFYNGGATPVDTETVTVNGNGTYTTPTGFTLPGTGTVTGTYQWDASYSGDGNNIAVSDNNAINEQVTVSAASPTISTTPKPTTVTLSAATPPVLTDSTTLAGFRPTGTITFTLFFNGGTTPVDTETVTVNGNGTYTTPNGFILPTTGTVTGIYQWDAVYTGDGNNNTVSDTNAAGERVMVNSATPAIGTTAMPSQGNVGVTLQDSAVLTGGFNATGTITFKLFAPGVDPTTGPASDTETATVHGNGTYSTTTGFVSNAPGVWHWVAVYSGDTNNQTISSGALDEPVTIGGTATLNLTKVASASQVIVGHDVTYTLTVNNLGPNEATGVTVSDPFPAGIALVGPFTLSQGTFNPATGVWTIGTLPNGGQATLLIVAEVLGLGPNVNTAMVSSANDPNTASATVTGLRSADMISKQFFLDSFVPPAGDPPSAASPAARQMSAVSNSNGANARLPGGTASPALDSLFASLGNGGNLQSPTAPTVNLPESAPVTAGSTTSDIFGPAYGNTLGGPLDTTGLVASGQPLAGGGSNGVNASESESQAFGNL